MELKSTCNLEVDEVENVSAEWFLEGGGGEALAEALEEALAGDRELNIRNVSSGKALNPGEWTFFFKKRESSNRLLVAHPDANSWVATVALTSSAILVLIERLKGLGSQHPIDFSELGPFDRVSNLKLKVMLRN